MKSNLQNQNIFSYNNDTMKEIMERLLEATDRGSIKWESTSSYLSFSAEFEDKLYMIRQDHKGNTEICVMNDNYDFEAIDELKNTDILKKIYKKILQKYPEYKKQVEDCWRKINEEEENEMLKKEIDITPELADKYDGRVFFDLDMNDRIEMVKFMKTSTGIDTLSIGCNYHWGYTDLYHDNYGKYLVQDTFCGSYIEDFENGSLLMRESTQEKFDEVNKIVNDIIDTNKELERNFNKLQKKIGLYN